MKCAGKKCICVGMLTDTLILLIYIYIYIYNLYIYCTSLIRPFQGFFQDLGQGGAKRQYVIWWGGMALSTCTALDPRGGESEPRGGKYSPPPPPERNPGPFGPVGLPNLK